MNHDKRLYFVGHSGAGKALVAKTVAEKLGWQFINADFSLEFRIGRHLEEILEADGLASFYKCQGEILAAHLNKEEIVVSTDPSIVCEKKNRQLLAEGFVVYLKVSPAVQIERNTRNPAPLMPII
ncbi:MAG: shikimate kinase, partial [Legionella sp.]